MKKVLWVIIVILSVIGLLLGVNAPILTTYAYTYHDYFINYANYEVNDFSIYDIVLNADTFNLTMQGEGYVDFQYKFDECVVEYDDMLFYWNILIDNVLVANALNHYVNLPCSTSWNAYYTTKPFILSDLQKIAIKDALTSANEKTVKINMGIYNNSGIASNGVNVFFRSFEMQYNLIYEFNSTYYFTDMLIDVSLDPSLYATNVISPTVEDARVNLSVFYDSTNYYRFFNSDPLNSIVRGQKKYAITNGDERLTAYGLGINGKVKSEFNSFSFDLLNTQTNHLRFSQQINLLNYASSQQTFPNATTDVLWDYIDPCPIWDMSCGINNALVYLAKDAPITSQVYNVVDKGWQFLSNSFYSLTDLFGAEFDDAGNLVGGNWIGIIITITLGLLVIIWGVREL